MTLGLFEKVVLADTLLAGSADTVFGYGGPLVALDSWAGVMAFAGQIFFDFAGYSICAIGAALCLGFHLEGQLSLPLCRDRVLGFLAPLAYLALHVSARLPLHPDRRKSRRRRARHDQSHDRDVYRRVVARRGLDICRLGIAARRLSRARAPDEDDGRRTTWANTLPVNLLLGLATYFCVCVAWVFFRATDFTVAARMLSGMFGGHPHGDALLSTRELLQIGIVTFFMMVVHWSLRDTTMEHAVNRMPAWVLAGVWTFMAAAILLAQANSNAFIYFQF